MFIVRRNAFDFDKSCSWERKSYRWLTETNKFSVGKFTFCVVVTIASLEWLLFALESLNVRRCLWRKIARSIANIQIRDNWLWLQTSRKFLWLFQNDSIWCSVSSHRHFKAVGSASKWQPSLAVISRRKSIKVESIGKRWSLIELKQRFFDKNLIKNFGRRCSMAIESKFRS